MKIFVADYDPTVEDSYLKHTEIDNQWAILDGRVHCMYLLIDNVEKMKVRQKNNYRSLDMSPNYKGLLMSLQNQLKESKSKIDALLHEQLNLQKDLEARPTQHELRLYKQQVKKLENALKKSTKLEDLLSPKQAEDTEKKDEPSKDNQHSKQGSIKLVLSSINSVIHNPRAPVIIYKQSKGSVQHFNKDLVQDCGFEHLVPIIELWADQLTSLKDLYKSLKILSAELVPWHNLRKQDENEGIKVEDLLFIVDTMLEEVENKEKDSNMPNFRTLQAIVSHFQKLFDVPSLNGVYPRMNEVYTRLGEVNNAVRNLQELLGLDRSSSLCVLVSTVGKLCRLINEDMNAQVMQDLGPEDLQRIIKKLEEHEEFFPAFQAFTSDLLEILGAGREGEVDMLKELQLSLSVILLLACVFFYQLTLKSVCLFSCLPPSKSQQGLEALLSHGRSIVFLETSERMEPSPLVSCAVESAAKIYPEQPVVLFMKGLNNSTQLPTNSTYRALSLLSAIDNVFLFPLDMERLFLFTINASAERHCLHISSDACRLAIIWKYGGIYMDTDVISIRPIPEENFLAAQSSRYSSNGVFGFLPHHPFLWECMENFVEHYNSDIWGNQGPNLMTRMLRLWCKLRDFQEWRHYYEVWDPELSFNYSYALHLWNYMNHNKKVVVRGSNTLVENLYHLKIAGPNGAGERLHPSLGGGGAAVVGAETPATPCCDLQACRGSPVPGPACRQRRVGPGGQCPLPPGMPGPPNWGSNPGPHSGDGSEKGRGAAGRWRDRETGWGPDAEPAPRDLPSPLLPRPQALSQLLCLLPWPWGHPAPVVSPGLPPPMQSFMTTAKGLSGSVFGTFTFPTFKFQPHCESIDWRRISALDVDRVAREVDVAILQELLNGVTFCNLDREVCSHCGQPVDPALLKVLRLTQLIIEYLLHCQDFLSASVVQLEARLQASLEQQERGQQELARQADELKGVRQESHQRRKLIGTLQQLLLHTGAYSYHPVRNLCRVRRGESPGLGHQAS
ncbi:Centrosomal Protein Of 70 Kda [Manis pentadactyla]|nr:Centrosomal Protein Of 70 Kda [Manis pentadactyla]